MTSSKSMVEAFSYAPWLDRSLAQQVVSEAAPPRFRSESWKYTNPELIVKKFKEGFFGRSRSPESSSEFISIESIEHPRGSSVAEEFFGRIANSSASVIPAQNLLNLQSGYVIHARPSDNAAPVVSIAAASDLCERILIVVEPSASLEVIESCSGGNRVIECVVGEGANVTHRRLQPATDEIEYGHLSVCVQETSCYRLFQYSVGASLRRNEIEITIKGEKANVELNGGWRLDGTMHLDTQISVNHEIENAKSEQKFHGVVGDSARAIFNSRIYIARDAQRTDAHLYTKNILTSDRARMYAKPQLEIYADDVVCSHGATSGQLDEAQVFYMRSRGIPDEESRNLLVEGFLNEVVHDEAGAKLLGIRSSD